MKDGLLFLDTETTGFGACRLVELAYKGPGVIVWTVRVKPPIPIEEQASAVNGITNEMCKDWPVFVGLPDYQAMKELIERSIVVAHSARFDIGVLEREGIIVNRFIDTKLIAGKVFKNAPTTKLQDLREYLQIDDDGAAHSAAGDVQVLAKLFDQIVATMEMNGTDPDQCVELMMQASMKS